MKKAEMKKLEKIAQEVLGVETLEQRWSDSWDFYEVSVWALEEALKRAYEAGKAAK
jgi:DNA relaxase NicK